MRKRVAVTISTTICWLGMSSSLPGRASCVAPELQLKSRSGVTRPGDIPTASSGSLVTVEGRHFFKGCDDVGGGSMFGCSDEREEQRPYKDMVVEIRGPATHETQRKLKRAALSALEFETSVELAIIDADDDFTFEEEIRLPDLRPGRYFLVVGPVFERIRISH